MYVMYDQHSYVFTIAMNIYKFISVPMDIGIAEKQYIIQRIRIGAVVAVVFTMYLQFPISLYFCYFYLRQIMINDFILYLFCTTYIYMNTFIIILKYHIQSMRQSYTQRNSLLISRCHTIWNVQWDASPAWRHLIFSTFGCFSILLDAMTSRC